MEDEEQELEREHDEELYHPNEHKEKLGTALDRLSLPGSLEGGVGG